MANFLEDLDFSGDAINVRLVLDFVLLQYFNGDFLLRDGVDAQLDLSESAFAECFID